MTDEELKEMAAQLKRPHGNKGVEIGYMLHETNLSMTMHAVHSLELSSNNIILELGPGNCAHLGKLLALADNLKYYGFDISELMVSEANRINHAFVKQKIAVFSLYDGLHIPFDDCTFDKGLSVNTLYFWNPPLELLAEIYRVLRKGGCFAVSFGDKSYLKNQPFTQFGFRLYDLNDFEKLVSKTSFKIKHSEENSEIIQSKTGNRVKRIYHTVVLEK